MTIRGFGRIGVDIARECTGPEGRLCRILSRYDNKWGRIPPPEWAA